MSSPETPKETLDILKTTEEVDVVICGILEWLDGKEFRAPSTGKRRFFALTSSPARHKLSDKCHRSPSVEPSLGKDF
jgi:hypothetical protein